MYSVILSGKSFDTEALDAALKEAGRDRASFMRDYGIIAVKPSIKEAAEFSEFCLKKFSIKSVCSTRFQIKLPPIRPLSGFSIKGSDIYDGNLKLPLSGLESIVLCYVRSWEKNSSLFYIKQNPFNFISKTGRDLFLQLCFAKQRLLLDAQNFDYSLLLESPHLTSEQNLRRLISDILEIKPAASNKTLDLFLANKKIEYFLYEDIEDADREIMWLKTVSARG